MAATAVTTKDGKTKWKVFNVFSEPQLIKTKDENNIQEQLPLRQFAKLKCIYSDPYLVFIDLNTKIVYICENGIPIKIFRPFHNEIYFVKAQLAKNGWVCFIGQDCDNNTIKNKIKFFPMSEVKNEEKFKELKIELPIDRYDFKEINVFDISDDFTMQCFATNKGFLKYIFNVKNGYDLMEHKGDFKQENISQDSNGPILGIYLFTKKNYNRPSLYFITKKGIHFLEVIALGKTATLLKSIAAPQMSKINYNGELVYITSESEEKFMISSVNSGDTSYLKEAVIEGVPKFLECYNDYAIVCYQDKNYESNNIVNLIIIDLKNEYIAFQTSKTDDIKCAIPAKNELFYVHKKNIKDETFLSKLTEFENSVKLEKFFKRQFYDLAHKVAKNNKYDESLLAEISKYHGDHEYSKKDYQNAITHYIRTIGYTEPSYVIRQFIDVSQISYQISYLEELHKSKKNIANPHHTALLLNCFVKLKDTKNLNKWVNDITINPDKSEFFTKTAVKVCQELDQIDLAKKLALNCKHNELYLEILFDNKDNSGLNLETLEDEDTKKNFKEALDYIRDKCNSKDKENYINKFGHYLTKDHSDTILEMIKEFINEGINKQWGFDCTYPIKYTNIFQGNNQREETVKCLGGLIKYFLEKFDKLPDQQQILNVAFNYYLNQYKEYKIKKPYIEHMETTDDEQKNIQTKLLDMLGNQTYQEKMDKNHILLLLKMENFTEGVVKMCEITGRKAFLLEYFLSRDDVREALNFCKREGRFQTNLWITFLNYLCTRDIPDKKENQQQCHTDILNAITESLQEIEGLDNFSPIILQKLQKTGKNIELRHIKSYFKSKLKADLDQIKKDQEEIDENKSITESVLKNYKNIKSAPVTFQEQNCLICNSRLTPPALHFMCTHSYHQNCLEKHECDRCYREQNEVIEKSEIFKQNSQTEKQFVIDLDNCKNKFDVIADYLGKQEY